MFKVSEPSQAWMALSSLIVILGSNMGPWCPGPGPGPGELVLSDWPGNRCTWPNSNMKSKEAYKDLGAISQGQNHTWSDLTLQAQPSTTASQTRAQVQHITHTRRITQISEAQRLWGYELWGCEVWGVGCEGLSCEVCQLLCVRGFNK